MPIALLARSLAPVDDTFMDPQFRTPGKKGSAVDAAVCRAGGDRDRENSRLALLAFVTTSAVDGITHPT